MSFSEFDHGLTSEDVRKRREAGITDEPRPTLKRIEELQARQSRATLQQMEESLRFFETMKLQSFKRRLKENPMLAFSIAVARSAEDAKARLREQGGGDFK